MNSRICQELKKCWRAETFSPRGLLSRAVAIALIFVAAHFAGLRDHTSVLNGTIGSASVGWAVSAGLGIGYLVVYMGVIVVAPILILAAGFMALLERRARAKSCN